MVLKITEELSDRVNRVVRHSCCNCIDDNCLLLDDGEEHSCVQLISRYGIYCNYLLKCVLPAFPKLYGDILAYNEKLKAYHRQQRSKKRLPSCFARIEIGNTESRPNAGGISFPL